MPVTSRTKPKLSPLQRFRATTERMLIEAAQEDLYRKYPGTSAPPRPRGLGYRVLRTAFVTLFRLAPASLRRWGMRLLFLRREQRWSPQ